MKRICKICNNIVREEEVVIDNEGNQFCDGCAKYKDSNCFECIHATIDYLREKGFFRPDGIPQMCSYGICNHPNHPNHHLDGYDRRSYCKDFFRGNHSKNIEYFSDD